MFDLSWRWNLHVFQDWQKWWWKNIARDYCLQNFLVCIIFFMINMFHSHAFATHILNWFPQVFWGFPWVKCPESCWPAIIMDVVSNTIQRSSKTDVRNVLNLFKGLSRYSINERAERYKDVQKKREGEKKKPYKPQIRQHFLVLIHKNELFGTIWCFIQKKIELK